jgi:hypothetical protein
MGSLLVGWQFLKRWGRIPQLPQIKEEVVFLPECPKSPEEVTSSVFTGISVMFG